MQSKQSAYVGIDIGTSNVKCVIGIDQPETEGVQIVGLGEAATSGMRRGSVVNVGEVAEAINAAIDEAERTSGFAVDGATVSINGTHLASRHSKGVVAVTSSDRHISHDEVARAEEAATVVQIPPNREILHVVPRNYRLDGQEDIKDPVGMSGVRLEVEALLVTAATPSMHSIHGALEQAGLQMNDQFAAPLAAAHAVLNRQHREAGTVLVDIGHSTTGVAIFEEDELFHLSTLPVGSAHVTHDIAIGLKTDLETAETIKREYASARLSTSHEAVSVKDKKGEEVKTTKGFVSEITNARMEELFELVQKELRSAERAGTLPGGAMLTGGGAELPGVSEVAKEILKLPAEVGKPTGYSGITDNIEQPQMATVVGLMLLDRAGYHNVGGNDSWKAPLSKTGGILRTIFDRLKP